MARFRFNALSVLGATAALALLGLDARADVSTTDRAWAAANLFHYACLDTSLAFGDLHERAMPYGRRLAASELDPFHMPDAGIIFDGVAIQTDYPEFPFIVVLFAEADHIFPVHLCGVYFPALPALRLASVIYVEADAELIEKGIDGGSPFWALRSERVSNSTLLFQGRHAHGVIGALALRSWPGWLPN